MRRVASHYMYWNGLLRMHYVELDDAGCLVGIYPLEDEVAGTEFYDGILFPVVQVGKEFHASGTKVPCLWNPNSMSMESRFDVCRELGLPEAAKVGEPTSLFLLRGVSLTATEFGTDNSRGNGYIQRL